MARSFFLVSRCSQGLDGLHPGSLFSLHHTRVPTSKQETQEQRREKQGCAAFLEPVPS